MLLRPHCPLFISKDSQKFWVKKNSHLLETTSNCSLSRKRQKWKNGVQKREMLTPNMFSNCKAFLLKSFNSQESCFSIHKTKKTVSSLAFTISMGGGECMLKKEEVQSPLKFLDKSTVYSLRPYGRKGPLLSTSWIL